MDMETTTATDTTYLADLFDADTAELIGPATAEQIIASFDTHDGLIAIDEDGDVIAPGAFHTGRLRTVYAA